MPLEDSYHGTGVNDEGWCDSCSVLLTASLYGSTVGSCRFVFLSSSRSDEACRAFPSSLHSAPMKFVAGSAFLPFGMVNASLGGGGCKGTVFRWSDNRPDGHIYTLKGSLQGSLEPCGEPFLAFPVWLEEGKECVGRIISSHRTCRW